MLFWKEYIIDFLSGCLFLYTLNRTALQPCTIFFWPGVFCHGLVVRENRPGVAWYSVLKAETQYPCRLGRYDWTTLRQGDWFSVQKHYRRPVCKRCAVLIIIKSLSGSCLASRSQCHGTTWCSRWKQSNKCSALTLDTVNARRARCLPVLRGIACILLALATVCVSRVNA